MSIKDRALKEMMDALDWDLINKRNTTGSVYRAYNDWSSIAKKEYDQTINNIKLVKQKESDAEKKTENALRKSELEEARAMQLEEKANSFESQISKLEKERETTENDLKAVNQEITERQEILIDLDAKQFTEEKLNTILNSDAESPEDLISRVQKAQQHQQILDEINHLETHRGKIIKETQEASDILSETREELKSTRNKLDALQTKNFQWISAIKVITDVYRLGFTEETILRLIEELKRLSIKKEPVASTKRLLTGLEKVKELVELEEAVTLTSAQLRTLKSELAKTQGILTATQKDALGKIHEVKNNSIKSIDAVSSKAQGSITDMISSLKNVEAQGIHSIDKFQKEATGIVNAHQLSISAFFINISNAIQIAIDLYGEKIRQLSILSEELGKLKPWIDLATLLYGVNQNPQSLQHVNLSVVRRICEGIHLYLASTYASSRIHVPREISDREFGMISGSEYSIHSVSAILVEGLRKIEREGKK
jgi:hypothetical protein